MRIHNYFVYIITNPKKTALYIGITNSLSRRLKEHYDNRGNLNTWAGKYYCYNLIYYEEFQYVNDAIAREKQLKKWSRKKKEWLINMKNPERIFLNNEFLRDTDFSTPPPK